MWLQFGDQPDEKAVYMSNGAQATDGHGVAMSYSPEGLEFVFKKKDGREWTALARDVKPKLWQHVAASWIEDQGLLKRLRLWKYEAKRPEPEFTSGCYK